MFSSCSDESKIMTGMLTRAEPQPVPTRYPRRTMTGLINRDGSRMEEELISRE